MIFRAIALFTIREVGAYACCFRKIDFMYRSMVSENSQAQFLGELIELQTIINGDLHSVVSSGRNHLYVGGWTLISRPLPSYQAVVAAVWVASRDRTPLQYY